MANPMTMPPQREPARIVSGDTVRWRRDDLASLYPAVDGWVLTYAFNGPGGVTRSAAMVADGGGWIVTIDAAGWPAGGWAWSLAASKAGLGRTTFDAASLIVAADPASAIDPRTHARRVLDLIEAAIEGRASAVDLEHVFEDGRSIKKMPHSELIQLRSHYARLVTGENRMSSGRGPGRIVPVL